MNEILSKTIDNLPPLPETVTKLQTYVSSVGTEVKIQKVVEILSNDPLITGELLRLANSPYYGFSREISTIHQVVSLLGVNNIKNVVTANSIRNSVKVDMTPYGLDTQEFLANCSAEVNFITDWLLEEDKVLAQLLVPCTMLMRLGMILLSNAVIENKKEEEFLSMLKDGNFQNIQLAEAEFCGVDSLSFLSFLFDHWKIDEILVQTVAHLASPQSATEEIQKNTYALAIANYVFDPHMGGTPYSMYMAKSLFKEALRKGIRFNYEKFIEKLPPHARENLNKPVDDNDDLGGS